MADERKVELFFYNKRKITAKPIIHQNSTAWKALLGILKSLGINNDFKS